MQGAVEALLLQHRALIEDALYPLQEHGQVCVCITLDCVNSSGQHDSHV